MFSLQILDMAMYPQKMSVQTQASKNLVQTGSVFAR